LNIDEAIRSRRSVRVYKPARIDRETVEELVALAGMAPSSFNSQPWRFHVAMDEARQAVLEVLAQTTRYVGEYLANLKPEEAELAEEFFAEVGHAPVLIGVSVPETDDEIDQVNTLMAAGGAIQTLQLAARGRGLGSCSVTFTYWVREDLARVMGVGDGREIITVVLLGVPAEEPESPGRRTDIVDFVE
jgi:nitroreductase